MVGPPVSILGELAQVFGRVSLLAFGGGLGILPETWYPEVDEQRFRVAMEADLSRCSVFVQLLGRLTGRKMAFAASEILRNQVIISHQQAADGNGHPAVLVAVIVDGTSLPGLPANRNQFI